MGTRFACWLVVALCFGSAPAIAGIWDDLKEGVGAAGDLVEDVRETRDDAKDTYDEGKGVVTDTRDEVDAALPEDAPPPPPSASKPADPGVDAPPPPPSARQWFLDDGKGGTRNVSEAHLVQLIRSGAVDATTPVYGNGLEAWTAAGEVPALASHFK